MNLTSAIAHPLRNIFSLRTFHLADFKTFIWPSTFLSNGPHD
jgi:hypothetical protein